MTVESTDGQTKEQLRKEEPLEREREREKERERKKERGDWAGVYFGTRLEATDSMVLSVPSSFEMIFTSTLCAFFYYL